MRFIQFFKKYSYHKFEAKNKEEAEKMMEEFFLDTGLDSVLLPKVGNWQIACLKERKGVKENYETRGN